MKVTVKVTEEMGSQRNRAPGFGCMVHQALNVILRPIEVLRVGIQSFYIFHNGVQASYRLPPEESDRIRLYDRGVNVPAHEFEIDIPAKYLKPHIGK